jgi:hypothetical protein
VTPNSMVGPIWICVLGAFLPVLNFFMENCSMINKHKFFIVVIE